MADEFLDIISFRKRGTGKAYPHKIGSAKSNGKGGFFVDFDSLPLPDENGRVSVLISPRQEKGGFGGGRPTARPAPRSGDVFEDDSDTIPF